jgi:hypothetical protein
MSFEENQPVIAIVDAVCDVEETGQPFGKRWAAQHVKLTEAHLLALRAGQLLAIDVNEEYVVFLQKENERA